LADTRNSSNIHKDFFEEELGLKQFSNTSIFLKGDIFVLSPSVQNTHSWFDLRKVNLDRYKEKSYRGYLLIRYYEKFLLTDLDPFIKTMLPEHRFVDNKNIGVHWKFNVLPTESGYIVVNRQDRTMTYNIKLVSKYDLEKMII
jgi:hypothetical protein